MTIASAPAPIGPEYPILADMKKEELAALAEARLQELLALGGSQANAATAIVGDTGVGKTELAVTAIKYCYETYGRISRVYTADLGGFGNNLLSLIRLGIAQVYNPTTHVEPFETLELCSHGWWPERIDDVETGYADPHVRMIPPRVKRWAVYCPQGHLVHTLSDSKGLAGLALKCPGCNTITTAQNWSKVEEATFISPGFKHVGQTIYDSMTAMQESVMGDMAMRAGREELGGEKGALNKIVSGSMIFGSNNRAHYGFAQNRAYQWVKNARAIPGQVMPPLFTFLELRAADEGVPLYGPKIAGNAKTADVPSWFGNCLNAVIEKNDKGAEVHRLYLRTHMDQQTQIAHLAKTRANPGSLPMYLEDPDGRQGSFERFSLTYFFQLLDAALEQGIRKDAAAYANAPVFQPFGDDLAEEQLGEAKILGAAGVAGSTGNAAGTGTSALPSAPGSSRARPRPSGARPAMPPAPVQQIAPPVTAVVPTSTTAAAPATTPPVAVSPASPVVGQSAQTPPSSPPPAQTAAPPSGPVAAPVRPTRARPRPPVPSR